MTIRSRSAGGINRRRRLGALAALALAGAAVATVLPAPASATPSTPLPLTPARTVTMEEETTLLDHQNPKEIRAYCRNGARLVGAGFSVFHQGGGLGAVVKEAVPVQGVGGADDYVSVKAYETPAGTSYTWRLFAYAVCATGLSGVEIVEDVSVIDSAPSHSAVAQCPFGKDVIGSSFAALLAPGEVMVTKSDLVTSSSPDEVRVTGYDDDDGITATWGVRAYAFCAFPPPGLEIVPDTYNFSGIGGSNHAWCPIGKIGLGSGAYVSDVSGVAAGDVTLTGLRTVGPFTQFNGEYAAVATAVEDADGTPADWELTTQVACADD